LASNLEMRRRHLRVPVGFPLLVLAVAVTLSPPAQVVDAEASPIGWTAAIPTLGFLVMVKMKIKLDPW
jgi:hypothetical protein